ncbi:MAG: hypothetical protein CMJ46_01015 [Planctomyces sp.]|nr:hypothetical protein [Planctomyces sp.]
MTRPDPPPTIFIVHPKEKRSKCSIEPLRGREGYVFWKFPQRGSEPLDNYVRLGIGGPILGEADADRGLLILDGTWRLAEKMSADYEHLPVRSLAPTWQTAYPRKSKIFEDPSTGLATIEALYAANIHLGRPVDALLDEYHWGDEFVELNRELIEG